MWVSVYVCFFLLCVCLVSVWFTLVQFVSHCSSTASLLAQFVNVCIYCAPKCQSVNVCSSEPVPVCSWFPQCPTVLPTLTSGSLSSTMHTPIHVLMCVCVCVYGLCISSPFGTPLLFQQFLIVLLVRLSFLLHMPHLFLFSLCHYHAASLSIYFSFLSKSHIEWSNPTPWNISICWSEHSGLNALYHFVLIGNDPIKWILTLTLYSTSKPQHRCFRNDLFMTFIL